MSKIILFGDEKRIAELKVVNKILDMPERIISIKVGPMFKADIYHEFEQGCLHIIPLLGKMYYCASKIYEVAPLTEHSLALINTVLVDNELIRKLWLNTSMYKPSYWNLLPDDSASMASSIFQHFIRDPDYEHYIDLYKKMGGSTVYPLNLDLIQRYLLHNEVQLNVYKGGELIFSGDYGEGELNIIDTGNGYHKI